MKPRGKFVPFTEMAEKWDYSEDELIQLAIQMEEFNLYCLKPTPGNPSRMPFFIGDELNDFLPGKSTISCSKFGYKTSDYEEGTFVPIGPGDLKIAALYRAGHPEFKPESVTVARSDLYLHRDEIVEMETKHPELVGAKFNPNSQEQKLAEQSNTSKASSGVSANSESVEMLLNNDASDSTSHSSIGLETAATLDKQLSLPQEIIQDEESNLITQVEQLKRIKQPKKKKEKTNPSNINEAAEPPLLSKDDRVPLPYKTFADLQTRNLSLEDIIGNRDKGIPAIIPVGKSTWYAGVKSGRYPKSFEVSEGRVAWRGSDIYTLLQQLGMI